MFHECYTKFLVNEDCFDYHVINLNKSGYICMITYVCICIYKHTHTIIPYSKHLGPDVYEN